ncbi:MAG: putative Hybrid PKS-NRPS biosynthetic cluster [Chaenotheca gracillima]|nr:MAG: putative Hybrid PKS-NRPS biosynthetic cluster [Chaenotheca gracillima]
MAPQRSSEYPNEPIAIVGTGCRFPGESSSPSKLWELLSNPRDIVSIIPEDRFNPEGFYHSDNLHHGTSNIRHSYVLSEDHRHFDAQFFGIKPVEANSIDPQQRLLLETVYEAVESAGITIEGLQGSPTAVYVGLMCGDYADLLGRDTDQFPTYFATGTARSIISNRVSYFFDWHGPSMTIDTACSSSLIAVHQAVQTLRSGDSRVAVAAGANLLLGPESYIAESKLKMLSPSGRSHMWDEKADGYARGDGIAAVVLKTLSAALEDGDHIECIIRETGINQDGRTKGITMPSVSAQAALIQDVYKKAGLDLSKKEDRPSYFECHGTGTPAGDPVEAEAVSTAFFGPDSGYKYGSKDQDVLYVGSIKTVLGHTEGTAGLAAVLKASLAIQAGVIPPNMLLDQLNPAVKPFYDNLEILKAAQPWPTIAHEGPRRASVNSFGFGGANAHAILESYEPAATSKIAVSEIVPVVTPFSFSAASERSLLASLTAYSLYLKAHQSVNLRDLSWTLNSRRSTFPFRATFSARNVDSLRTKLDDRLLAAKSKADATIGVRASSIQAKPRILGIFTGQGAQWARMGAQLISSTKAALSIIQNLEKSLAELPPADRPTWSLISEITAEPGASRVNEAELSQPLCTAVQILLVDLLKSAGIAFAAVVGHSSGEMGAAYAAGHLTARDAIRIAYYRGLHLKLAEGRDGVKGSMMAVGTSFEDAKELCALPAFEGRICVAASNSSASVTISGDSDAIEQAKDTFDEEKKFARLLKVEKAYHSYHMNACSEPYIKSLRDCSIEVQRSPTNECTWVSSVYGEDIADVADDLQSVYWSNNMTNPVLFSQAVEYAVAEKGPFDFAIEVGPHPALQGPTTQTIQDVSGEAIPYTGVLSRGKDDVESFADALGLVWSLFGTSAVDLTGYDAMMLSDTAKPQLLKDLPGYSWDHERIFWHESRISKAFRTKSERTHELLGVKNTDRAEEQLRWRNVLRPREVPWISGHQVQGQMVFPGAGYISTALAAVQALMEHDPVKLIELRDLSISQALVFDDEDTGVETLVSLTQIAREGSTLTANYAFHSAVGKDSSNMTLNAKAHLSVQIGDPSPDTLPPAPETETTLADIESDRFYTALGELGFGYSGPFRALTSLKRKLGLATGKISNPASTDPQAPLMVHPATLDAAVQSIILAFCFPGDTRLRSVYVPSGIDLIRINPAACASQAGKEVGLPFISSVSPDHVIDIDGDVDIYNEDGQGMLQLQGLHTKPLSTALASNDLRIFTEIVWDFDISNTKIFARDSDTSKDTAELSFVLERVAYFYLRHLDNVLTKGDREKAEWHHQKLLVYVDHCLSRVASGNHPYGKTEWMQDTHEEILAEIKRFPNSIDLRIMHAVGENMPAVVRGEMTMLEPMMQDNMLNEFYVTGLGMPDYTAHLARMAGQIGHRYPHMSVLEIGAGTGGATKAILKELDQSFSSYNFTDISSGFFEKAQEVFEKYQSKMNFKALDIEKDTSAQGFPDHSFDLIVASLVIHATTKIEDTMRNVRRLLKPGGYLLLLEITNNDQMRFGFIFGGLSGWWLGTDDGRRLSPCITSPEWNTLLQKTGFSGIDAEAPQHPTLPIPMAVIAAQAVDERVEFLRQPLSAPSGGLSIPNLTIIGSESPKTLHLASELSRLLAPHFGQVDMVNSLTDVNSREIPFMGTILCLTELDESIFKSMTPEKLLGFQQLFRQSKTVLWLTKGRRGDDPYANMVIGFGRTLVLEMPHLRLQFLDLQESDSLDPVKIAELTLQFEVTDLWEQKAEQEPLLWSIEPEIALEKGKLLVPRLRLERARNDRYNSSRRLITKEVDPRTTVIELNRTGSSYSIEEGQRDSPTQPSIADQVVSVQSSRSFLRSLKITLSDRLFIVLGTNIKTGEQVIALSQSQRSIVDAPPNWVLPCAGTSEKGVETLLGIHCQLLAQTVLAQSSPGDTVLAYEPTASLAIVLARRASEKSVNVVFLTSARENKDRSWTFIHPNSPARTIAASLPGKATSFVSFSEDESVARTIANCLPLACKIENLESLTSRTSHTDHFSGMTLVPGLLRTAWMHTLSEPFSSNAEEAPTFSLSEFSEEHHYGDYSLLVDWPTSTPTTVQVGPVDSKPMFNSSKTYWLVGLTGGLGLSLCEWMVQHGARYVAISSRSPKVEQRWLDKMTAVGAHIKISSNDITSRESVRRLHKEICDTMPPIAGVAQGAMVLHDTMFLDLDMQRLEKVINPKVLGAIYLDEIFAQTNLEFFVFFSSMACITGNPGQSAYAAANMFMTALAAQRRKRGLAGSAINIGAIVGNGYVTRELTLAQQTFLRKVGNLWMSEQDFHTIFAEAVVAGRPESTQSELSTGLRLQYADEEEKMTWFSNPMFQHLVLLNDNSNANGNSNKPGIPVKRQLLEATTPMEVFDIIKDAFVFKLQTSLQADPDVSIIDRTADELGIDSLVAVDVRSWFLKELNVNMPVLKLLSGASIKDLLSFAQEQLPEGLTPNLGAGIGSDTEPAEPQAEGAEGNARNAELAANDPMQQQDQSSQQEEDDFVAVSETGSSDHGRAQADVDKSSSDISSPIDIDDSVLVTSDQSPASSTSDLKSDVKSSAPEATTLRTVPMSFGQSRFWFLKFFLEDQTVFNITVSLRLTGELSIDKLKNALKIVGQRHEALRTRFFVDENHQPMQGILEHSLLHLEQKSISDESQIEEEYRAMRTHVYDLGRGEAMRFLLLTLSPTAHQIILGYHHINMDGISFEVFFSDLQKAYEKHTLSSSIIQYPDFSIRQRSQFNEGKWKEELMFWRKEFGDIPLPLPLLPLSRLTSRSTLTRYSSHVKKIKVSPALSEQIQVTCRKLKATPFHFYLTVFKALLFRFVDTDDLCIGIADANRNDSDILQSLGCYLNLLPLRFRSQSMQTFSDALKDARARCQAVFANNRVPFDVLLNEIGVGRSATHSPLFQVLFNYRKGVSENRTFADLKSEGEEYDFGQTGYDMSIDVVDNPGGDSIVMLAVQKELYTASAGEILMKSYLNLLEAFSRSPASRLTRPALYDSTEVQTAIELGRGPTYKYEWPETIPHRIDEMTKIYSDKTALKDGLGNSLTYFQMAERVNTIATALSELGISSGSRVGVFQEPTSDWICSMLAVFRIGAVYVPLDPRVTVARLALMVKDCQPSAVLADSVNQSDCQLLGMADKTINVSKMSTSSRPVVPNHAKSDSTAVIMYTSGSTGVPKGIMMKHSSFRNNIESSTRIWYFQDGKDVVLQQSAYSFDMSLSQTFLALSTGGTLYVVPKAARGDPSALANIICSEGISFTEGTPSEYITWLRHGDPKALQTSNWKVAVSGGEKVTENLLQAFRALKRPDLRLLDCYGPTEITFCSNSLEIKYDQDLDSDPEKISSLRTWPNYAVYIVDESLKPVPMGVPGEIIVGGAGVTSGYLNNEELSREKFPSDIFATAGYKSAGWNTMHRTGDRGRLHSDGGLILEGRIVGDSQIKLRGLRIELRDVEAAIIQASNGKVLHAVVSVRSSGPSDPQYLVAHVALSPEYTMEGHVRFLKDLLRRLPLPQYMRPAMIIPLEQMPMNNSNKVDRLAIDALPLPKAQPKEDDLDPNDLTENEAKLRRLWKEVLSDEIATHHTIDAQADFFHVGGSSLLLVSLQHLINKTFGVSMPLFQLFEASTLGGMAARLGDSGKAENSVRIDWEKETQLSADLWQLEALSTAIRPAANPQVVLLTGSTGFVGKVILAQLVADSSIKKIHCVAVRKDQKDLPLLFASEKIELHSGDLKLPRLGLSEEGAVRVFGEVDAVVHNGADVSFMKSYQTLSKTNVFSTKELVKLCLPRKSSIHFISSASVTHLSGKDAFDETSAASYPPPTDGSDGYSATKWAGENYLEKASKEFGLPVWIHRPSSVTGDGAPAMDLMSNILKYSWLMKAVPYSASWQGYLDFISVDKVATAVAREVHDNKPKSGSLTYLFESGDLELPVEDIQAALEKETNSQFAVLSVKEWASRAQNAGLDALVAIYLGGAESTPLVFPRLLKA